MKFDNVTRVIYNTYSDMVDRKMSRNVLNWYKYINTVEDIQISAKEGRCCPCDISS